MQNKELTYTAAEAELIVIQLREQLAKDGFSIKGFFINGSDLKPQPWPKTKKNKIEMDLNE